MKVFEHSVFTMILLAAMASSAHAGPGPIRDHLQCHKVSDPSHFYGILNMDIHFEAETYGLPDTVGCKAKLRAVELCAPAAKTVTETDAPIIPVVGQDLQNGFLCYKMKCPTIAPVAIPSTDQFGGRELSVSIVRRVCTPVDY